MDLKKVIGLICVAGGIYLLATVNQSIGRTSEKVRKEVTGRYSHNTRNRMIEGIGLIVVGGALIFFFRGKKK